MAKKTIINKSPQKDTTINDLLVVISGLSERMNDGFAKINNRFAKMDDRFDEMDDRFTKQEISIDKRFDEVDKRFDEVNDHFAEQEIKMEKMMDEKIEDLAVMVNKSFEKMATKDDVNLLRKDMNDKF